MAEGLLEKAKRLNIQPSGESLIQKAQRLGIQPASKVEEPNYFQRVGQSFQKSGERVIGAVEEGAKALEAGGGPKAIVPTLRAGLRTAGAVAESAFAPILEAPVIKQAVGFVASKIAQAPQVKKVIDTATELVTKYPKLAQDASDIVNIVSLGYAPKAEKVLKGEVGAIGSDIRQGVNVVLTPSEEAVQADIVGMFQKSIKPTAKKTLAQGQKYEDDIVKALKTIKTNVDNINIEDIEGELVSRTPQTLNELSQAVDQTKGLVFNQYDDLARQAGKGGAVVDARPIADEVLKVADNKALQITNPELVKYAENWSKRLQGMGEIDTQTAQAVVQNLNNSLKAFYKNPTYDSAAKVSIDAGIANNFRKSLDDAIEGATGQEYQALKRQYGALKAIENDVVRASMRDARKNVKGLLDYTDIFTSGQMLGGILSLNPAMFTKGAVERGFKEWFKYLNDPNRAVGNMFDLLDTSTVQPFTPTSATGKFLQNPKLGLSIEDVSKSPLAQQARKYKSAEEFVNSPRYEYHLSNEANLAEGKTFAEQTTKATSRNRGVGNSADEGIFSTNSPQFWSQQLEYDLGAKAPKNVYLVEVKNSSPRGMLESGLDAQASNAATDIRVIKKLGTTADLQDMGRIESLKKSQLTDIWERANKKNSVISNQRNEYGVKSSSDVYRKGGEYKQWTDFRTKGNVQSELRTLDDVKTQIAEDKVSNPNLDFTHIKNKDGTYTILYKEKK